MESNTAKSYYPKRSPDDDIFPSNPPALKPGKASDYNPKTMGLEYRLDIATSEAQLIKTIFETNAYEHNNDTLWEFYSDVLHFMNSNEIVDERNLVAMIGMVIGGIAGFVASGITFAGFLLGVIVGAIVGRTFGRLIMVKLEEWRKPNQKPTQEDLFVSKIKSMLALGKRMKKRAKNNPNKFRLVIEKIIEESSPVLETTLFNNQKIVHELLLQLRNLCMDQTVQEAILLSHKLFQAFLERNDMKNLENIESAAKRVSTIYVPYVRIVEFNQEIPSQAKEHPSLVAYFKLKGLLAKPEIVSMIDDYPQYQINLKNLESLKIFMAQETNSLEQMRKSLLRYGQTASRPCLDKSSTPCRSPSRKEESNEVIHPVRISREGSAISIPSFKNLHSDEIGEGVVAQKSDLYCVGFSKKNSFQPPTPESPQKGSHKKSGCILSMSSNHEPVHHDPIQWFKKTFMSRSSAGKISQQHQHGGDHNEDVQEMSPRMKSSLQLSSRNEQKPGNEQEEHGKEYIKLASKSPENRHNKSPEEGCCDINMSPTFKRNQTAPPELRKDSHGHENSPATHRWLEDNNFKGNVQNKVIFEKVLRIAYDDVSKWGKIIHAHTIKIDKIIPESSPVVLIRAWALLEGYSPHEVLEQIYDADKRSKWDTVTCGMTVIEQIDEGTSIITFHVKAPLGITDRDFVQRRVFQPDYPEKGTYMLGFQSFAHPKYPPMKGRIRGETHIAGYIMKPSTRAPNSTDMCMITQVDVKGSIPKILVNLAAGKQPLEWVKKLQGACEKTRKERASAGMAPTQKK